MLATLIQSVGMWFLVAVALEAVAVFIEQWGAARSPDDDAPKHRALALLALVLAVATPALLMTHAFFSTENAEHTIRVLAMGAPVLAILAGALLGAIAGAAGRGAAPLMRTLALPLDLLALLVAVFAALGTLQRLLNLA